MSPEIRTLADDEKISPSVLCQLLTYNPNTGILLWQIRSPRWFSDGSRTAKHQANIWNSRHAGKEACPVITQKGYKRGTILGRHYLAHVVIFAMQLNAWPTFEIDHKNGKRSDNRWSNIRPASRHDNCRNRRASRTSTSQYKGVSWSGGMNCWRAQISINGTNQHLGYFSSETDAARAYEAVARNHHGEFFNSTLEVRK